MSTTKKKPRHYNRITTETVAKFLVAEALHGNGSAAVRALTPSVLSPHDRAFRIRKKSETESPLEFIDTQMQQIGIDAINRLGELVNSNDEKIATKNVHFAIDHNRGQAVKRSFNVNAKANIQSVLD